jgi:hypothetical protein
LGLLFIGQLGEAHGSQLLADEALALGAQQRQVVEAGVGRHDRDGVGLNVGVDGGDDLVEFGQLEEGVVEPELDLGQVEGVVTQLDALATQVGWDAVAVSLKREGGGLGDLAPVAVQEGLAQYSGVDRADGGLVVLAAAFERGLAGFCAASRSAAEGRYGAWCGRPVRSRPGRMR